MSELIKEASEHEFAPSQISTSALAMRHALDRTAGMKWLTHLLDRSPARSNAIAYLLLGFQRNGWVTLLDRFGASLNSPLQNPDAACIWAFYASSLAQRTHSFITNALFRPIQSMSLKMTDDEQRAVSALIDSAVRVRTLAIAILSWQRKLDVAFHPEGAEQGDDDAKMMMMMETAAALPRPKFSPCEKAKDVVASAKLVVEPKSKGKRRSANAQKRKRAQSACASPVAESTT